MKSVRFLIWLGVASTIACVVLLFFNHRVTVRDPFADYAPGYETNSPTAMCETNAEEVKVFLTTNVIIGKANALFGEMENIKGVYSSRLDWEHPTNILCVFYHEPIVTKTNGHWEIRFKE